MLEHLYEQLRIWILKSKAVCSWDKIKLIRRSKLFRFAAFFFIGVPYMFSILETINLPQKLGWSWSIWTYISYQMLFALFMGGVLFIVADIIYSLTCPDIIKNYEPNEFLRYKTREQQLLRDFAKTIKSSRNRISDANIFNVVTYFSSEIGMPLSEKIHNKLLLDNGIAEQLVISLELKFDKLSRAFDLYYEFARHIYPNARLCCISIYGLAALCLSLPHLLRVVQFLAGPHHFS